MFCHILWCFVAKSWFTQFCRDICFVAIYALLRGEKFSQKLRPVEKKWLISGMRAAARVGKIYFSNWKIMTRSELFCICVFLSYLVSFCSVHTHQPILPEIVESESESRFLLFLRQKWMSRHPSFFQSQSPSRCPHRRWCQLLSRSRGRSTPTPSRGEPWWPSTWRTTTQTLPFSSR